MGKAISYFFTTDNYNYLAYDKRVL